MGESRAWEGILLDVSVHALEERVDDDDRGDGVVAETFFQASVGKEGADVAESVAGVPDDQFAEFGRYEEGIFVEVGESVDGSLEGLCNATSAYTVEEWEAAEDPS